MTPRGVLLTVIAVFVVALAAPGAGARARLAPHRTATAGVPQGFVGMNIGDPLFPPTDPGVDLAAQLDRMVASGVETIRVPVYWSLMQPYATWADVPGDQTAQFSDQDGVPTRFGSLDTLMALAAARHLPATPVVIDAPSWDAIPNGGSLHVPRSDAPYASFVAALVRRYGPHGSFWVGRAHKTPIGTWEIWNEPNLADDWSVQPFERSYVALLRAARTAIRRLDPRATIVLAGLANDAWDTLQRIYAIRGARSLFDAVAVHPYTRTPQGVITIASYVRTVMRTAGDARKPILLNEVGWPSSVGQTALLGFETTEAGQARNVAALLPLLKANRVRLGIAGFDLYTWAGVERPGAFTFNFAGLFRLTAGQFVAKPAYGAFRRAALALEACAVKAAVANRCAKR